MTKKRILEGEPSLDYEGLKILAQQHNRPINTLIALGGANDPFNITPARQERADWFGNLWRTILAGSGVHVRRLHYRVVSQDPPVLKLDGTAYENTEDDWQMLVRASRDARYASSVPADQFVDRRAGEPFIRLVDGEDLCCDVSVADESLDQLVGAAMPLPPELVYEFTAPIIAQRYHVEVWCEKTTMNDVFEQLAERFKINVITGSGELSVTACLNVIDRALASGRPVRILYVSDFDPGGESMPVAVARKIEFLLYQRGLKNALDIQVRPVVLTHEQCEQYRLPRTPIKETEKRAGRFEARYGEGATELDALEALHPGELENILAREILRYYDDALDYRVAQAAEYAEAELAAEVERVNEEVHAEHRADLDRLRRQWAKIAKDIAAFEQVAKPVWHAIAENLSERAPDLPDVDWPEPDDGDEDDDPMFDSTRDYVEQIDRYKAHQGKPTEKRQIETTCVVCGEPFFAQRTTAKFCSRKCSNAAFRTDPKAL